MFSIVYDKSSKRHIHRCQLFYCLLFSSIPYFIRLDKHIEPQRVPQILTEIKRILKPGGMFIMTTPAPWTEGLLKLLARTNMVSREEIEDHKGSYSRKQIHVLLKQGGFHESAIKSGYFELFMNIWARAQKCDFFR